MTAGQSTATDSARLDQDSAATSDASNDEAKEPACLDESNSDESAESATPTDTEAEAETDGAKRSALRERLYRLIVFTALPLLTIGVGSAAGFFKFVGDTAAATQQARIEATGVARDGTVALFQYQASSVDRDLEAARSRLTGEFRDEYTKLINDVAIPGAKHYQVSTLVNVRAVAVIQAAPTHVQTLVFVNQNVTVGTTPPTDTSFAAKVSLDKVDGHWLISGFEPI
ncbi:hypothetical protein A5760_20865 [Mycobacterium colombiense]|uniref:Twin-arginine translocation pathway signal n=1 Tax=Mycobacterium colombiense TaxID=339268 RepID=A0A1A0V820_9MYCO|nr:hypothetical protein A5760_20865 [Mycobacterium colombiense]